jgi:signal transduction histidine kinase
MRDITEHKQLESMKNHFISAVMHELRTPLASISGYVDHFLATETESIPDNVKNGLEIVKRNADRLSELTESLLNIQRMESGVIELKFETFNLNETVTRCIQEMTPLAQLKNQQISANIPASSMKVRGDRLRLTGAVMSLLDNAIKYTPDGGSIKVCLDEIDSHVRLQVTDTGIGIEKKDLNKVFEPFATIHKPTYYRGTGVGLSLTKKVIEAHNGTITASSEGKGLGSTFTLTLPKKMEQVVRVIG